MTEPTTPLDVLLLAEQTPPRAGGREAVLAELLRRLPKDRTRLVAPAAPGSAGFDASVPVQILRRFRWVPGPLVPYAARKQLEWAVRRRRPGITVAFGMFPEGQAALRLKREANVPFLLHLEARALVAARQELRKGSETGRRIQELLDESDGILTATRDCRLEAYRCGVLPHHIEVIPIGVDLERFRPGERDTKLAESLRVGRGPVLITVLGQGGARDPETIFRAFASIRGQRRGSALVVVGAVEPKSFKKLLNKLRIDRAVRFTGPVPTERMPDYYRLADVYLSAHKEDRESAAVQGPEVAFAEALACGLPVAGTRTPVGEELVPADTGGGVTVEPGAHLKLARYVSDLLGDREKLAEAGKAAREHAEECHEAGACAQHFREHLEVVYYRRLGLGSLRSGTEEGSARPAA